MGGHRRHDDATVGHTALRELEEELTDFSFEEGSDTLTELAVIEDTAVSRTYGSLTLYVLTVHHLRTQRNRVLPGPGDRWVTEAELLRGRTRDGESIRSPAARVDAAIPGGLARLDATVPALRRTGIADVVRTHPWEVTGTVFGVLGLVSSVVFAFL
ncbi:hypothetical protein GCM10022221_10990 [Actinocorallia aurea]